MSDVKECDVREQDAGGPEDATTESDQHLLSRHSQPGLYLSYTVKEASDRGCFDQKPPQEMFRPLLSGG